MESEKINEIFGISESFMLPNRIMEIIRKKEELLRIYSAFSNESMEADFFNIYFQEHHSNRERMMQDFTPAEVAEVVVNAIGKEVRTCRDVCAGTGGLTIAA